MPLLYFIYLPTMAGIALISVFVAGKNYKNVVNRRFLILAAFILLYLVCTFVSDHYNGSPRALVWIDAAVAAADALPAVFFWFAAGITGLKLPKWLYITMSVAPAVMIPLAFSKLSISSVTKLYYGTAIGHTHWLFGVQLAYLLIGFGVGTGLLAYRSRQVTGSERMQLRLIMYGMGVVVAANLITNVALPLVGNSNYGVVIGTPMNLVLVLFLAYAIVRHKLFDIKAVVLRSLTYLVSAGVIALIYAVVAFEFGDVVLLRTHLTLTDRIFYVGVAIILSLTYRPLVHFFRKISDRLFYRDRYAPEELLNIIGQILASQIQLDVVARQVTEQLQRHMRVRFANILVLEQSYYYYSTDPVSAHHQDRFLLDVRSLGEHVRLLDTEPPGEAKNIMKRYNIAAYVPLISNRRLTGFLYLGEKRSGYIYNRTDLSVLETLSSSLALSIENALSYATIAHFNDILKDRIAAATTDLASANAKLKQLDQAKDEFISMASHQLRTPISVLSGYITLLIDKVYGQVPPEFEATLHKALQSADHMGNLVNDLLNVSRMDTGRFYLVREPVDLGKIVREEVEQLQIAAQKKHVKLTYTAPQQAMPTLQLDEEKIRQAVMNLIDNAIAYSPNGTVHVQLDYTDGQLQFRVRDNGIGVPPAQLPHLFSRFFRADNAKQVRPDGTGLGLYLVRRVVEDHGGTIEFQNNAAGGATFGFNLPVAVNQKVTTQQEGERAKPQTTLQYAAKS